MQSLEFADQMGRVVTVNYPPGRIISLVPSQTELLFDLGLGENVIGITKFCIHPREKFISTQKIGGTKTLNLNKIRELKPDLIIGNKEENDQVQIEELMKEFPVWMSDINVLEDAIKMITQVGRITNSLVQAHSIADRIQQAFNSLNLAGGQIPRVAYFIWKDPYMIAGRDTFINDMLENAGFNNISMLHRYPELSIEEISESKPDVILLSSEPYPFKDVHVNEMKRICPGSKVFVVDGEMFSWYGSRLLQTPSYLQSLRESIN